MSVPTPPSCPPIASCGPAAVECADTTSATAPFGCAFCRAFDGGFADDVGTGFPWSCAQYVDALTQLARGRVLVLGRTTWGRLRNKSVVRVARSVLVVSSRACGRAEPFATPESALAAAARSAPDAAVLVVGGPRLLRWAFAQRNLAVVYETRAYTHTAVTDYDVYFHDKPPRSFANESTDHFFKCAASGIFIKCNRWRRVPEERAYLTLLDRVLAEGVRRADRTRTGVISLFGPQIEFDLAAGFPLLTTKRVFWRGVVEELLWFLKGHTNTRYLTERGVHIWDGNSSRAFMASRGLAHYPPGELGPVYGAQWRHFRGEHVAPPKPSSSSSSSSSASIESKKGSGEAPPAKSVSGGFDQVRYALDLIRSNPDSRRILICAWDPTVLDKVALPPCHVLCQFYVHDRALSAKVYLRSNDLFLGAPFNIASYALLTHIFADICGLGVGRLIYTVGDAHVYSNHVDCVRQQLLRAPRPAPFLAIKRSRALLPEEYAFDNFELRGYRPHPRIKAQMAV